MKKSENTRPEPWGLGGGEKGPRVLTRRNSAGKECFYRIMYVVFLAITAVFIGCGLLSFFSLLFQAAGAGEGLSPWPSLLGAGVFLLVKPLRDFWRDKLELQRMDDNFCGISYLERHLDDARWPEAFALLDSLSRGEGDAMEREGKRRRVCAICRESPSILEAAQEMGDERLLWSLENYRG